MNTPAPAARFLSSAARRRLLGTFCAAATIFLAGAIWTQGQTPAPTATPAVSPSPDPSPSPTPVNPALYLPQAATVQVAAGGGTTNAANAQQNTISKTQTSRAGATAPATSDTANPTAAVPLQPSSPDLFSPTVLAAQPQTVTVTLSYNVACAGANVLVAPLDGGSINGSAGAQTVTVGTDGTLVFNFQAPSGPGRYHVVTRLGGAEMTLPFDVADPTTATPTPPPPR